MPPEFFFSLCYKTKRTQKEAAKNISTQKSFPTNEGVLFVLFPKIKYEFWKYREISTVVMAEINSEI